MAEIKEIFNDYKVQKSSRKSTIGEIFGVGRRRRHDSLISMSQYQAEKTIMKENSVTRLPPECMQRIIKHVERKRDIVSCLLVNKSWCSAVIPLLWARPFDNVSLENRFKLIRTYISCLEEEERSGLNYSLKRHKVKVPYSSQVQFEYATYLERFSYNKLYMAVDSGIRRYLSEGAVVGRSLHQQTMMITSVLCQLFMRQGRRISSIEITNFIGIYMDLPRSSLFSTAEYTLSNLLRFELQYTKRMTRNTLKLLKYISKYCHKLLVLELKFPYLKDKLDVINSIADIINAQTQLTEFRLSGLRFGAEIVVPALVSQASSLSSVKFMNCDFTGTDFEPLARCRELKSLTIQYCQGLTNESIFSLKHPQFTLKSLDIGCSPAALVSQLLIFPIAGESLEELTLDLITPETITTILENCSELKRLKLANYFIQQPTKIGELLRGLKYLQKLEVFINSKNADYENMILTSGDLPESLDCLILRCGFTTIQLDNLLSSRDLTTLIMDYIYFDRSHFRVIREYAKRSDRLEVLGIGDGGAKDSFAKKEWKELKKLCKDYCIRAVPLTEISSW